MKGYRVAIVGATGLVGQEFIKVLVQRNFPMESISLLASDRSAGRKLFVNHQEIEVKETVPESFQEIDIALFSAGGETSRHFSPIAAIDPRRRLLVRKSGPKVKPETLPGRQPNAPGVDQLVKRKPGRPLWRKPLALPRILKSFS